MICSKRLIAPVSALALICGSAHAGVTLTPTSTTRMFSFGDSLQSDGAGGYLSDGVWGEANWDVAVDPLASPLTSVLDDAIDFGSDPENVSSYASAFANQIDAGGWSTPDGVDNFDIFVNNQATQSPGGLGPEGWGQSVAYVLITYDTTGTGGAMLGDSMTVTLDLGFTGTVYADQGTDEYLMDIGYSIGTGLTDYNPVLTDPANNPNPGLAQFDVYQSWGSSGFSFDEPTFTDSLVYNGVIGDQVQVLMVISSFSYSQWGYTWTDGGLKATVTAVPAPGAMGLLAIGGIVGLRRRR